ncbi:MAG: hypothetical protein ACHP6H_00560 [Legionellales bacterium]
MNPVIRRLEKHYSKSFDALSVPAETDTKDSAPVAWTFSEKLEQLTQDPVFCSQIVSQHLILNLEYSVALQRLHSNLALNPDYKTPKIKEQLIEALILAELLEHLYLHYLIVPREVERVRRDQKTFRLMLANAGVDFSSSKEIFPRPATELSFADWLRALTINSNWYRLVSTRSIRVTVIIDSIKSMQALHYLVSYLNILTKYVTPYIACFFYVPRLLMNLFMILKHTLPGNWMDREEQSLGWALRLETHFKRRWFELGNDAAWIMVGVFSCFILVGNLMPFAMYLTISFYVYDMVLAICRAYVELGQISALQNEYAVLLEQESNPANRAALIEYQQELTRRKEFETWRLGIHIASTASIVLAACCALPMFAAFPVIPLIGAIWLVVICLINSKTNRILEDLRPKDAIDILVLDSNKTPKKNSAALGSFSIFKSQPATKDHEIQVIPLMEMEHTPVYENNYGAN